MKISDQSRTKSTRKKSTNHTSPFVPPQGDDKKADGYMSRAKSIWEKAYGGVGDGGGDAGDGGRGGREGGERGGEQGSGGCGTSEVEGSKPGVCVCFVCASPSVLDVASEISGILYWNVNYRGAFHASDKSERCTI